MENEKKVFCIEDEETAGFIMDALSEYGDYLNTESDKALVLRDKIREHFAM